MAASGIPDGWLFATAGGRLFSPLCLSVRLRPRLAQLPPGFPQKHVCAGPVCFSPLRQGCGRLRRNGLRPGFDFSLRFV